MLKINQFLTSAIVVSLMLSATNVYARAIDLNEMNEPSSFAVSTFWVIFSALYFVPTIIAFCRHMKNAGSILCLNLFLGWTSIGWVVALCWSVAGTAEIRNKQ
jgi:hypothetical protein